MAEDEPPNPEYLIETVYVKVEIIEDEGVVEGIDDDLVGRYPETQAVAKRKKTRKRPEAKLSCDYCDYKTPYRHCLRFHIMKHTNMNIKCKFCNFSSKYPNTLLRHTMSCHNEKSELPSYKCPECDYKSIFKSNLSGHMRKHSKVKTYKCDLCTFASAYRMLLLKHKRVHHTGSNSIRKVLTCHLCSFQAKGEGYLTRHLAQAHNILSDKAVKCDKCSFLTKTKWRLNTHKKRSYKKGQVSCKKCDFTTYYTCELRQHKNIHTIPKTVLPDMASNSNDTEMLSIKTSNEITQNSSSINNDNADNTYVKNEENKNFIEPESNFLSNVLSYTIHNYQNSPTEGPQTEEKIVDNSIDWREIPVDEMPGREKPFLCTICVYSSKFKSSIQRHFLRRHMNKKPYKCTNCGYCTKTPDSLAIHNKRSKSTSVQKCQDCSFESYFKCELVYHQKTHYEYRCKICDYSCKIKYNLPKHYVTAHQTQYHLL